MCNEIHDLYIYLETLYQIYIFFMFITIYIQKKNTYIVYNKQYWKMIVFMCCCWLIYVCFFVWSSIRCDLTNRVDYLLLLKRFNWISAVLRVFPCRDLLDVCMYVILIYSPYVFLPRLPLQFKLRDVCVCVSVV